MNDKKETTGGEQLPIHQAVSRRHFIGAVAATTAATLLPTDGAAAEPVAAGQRWDREVDLLVVGSGAAGSCAALYGSRAGAEVLLL